MEMEIGIHHLQTFLLIIEEHIKTMENGHFLYSRAVSHQDVNTYIFDDKWEDAKLKFYHFNERKERGLAGMEWALGDEAGFTSEKMTKRLINSLDKLFETWKPRPKYEFFKDTDLEKQVLPHKLVY